MTTFRGKVSGFMPRSESGVFRKRQTIVWDFRLERYSKDKKPLPRIAVQMRAKFYRGGAISNGDFVEVSGRQDRNGLVVVKSVKNLTSGTVIHAHLWNPSVFLVKGAAILLGLVVFGAAGYWVVTGESPPSAPPDFVEPIAPADDPGPWAPEEPEEPEDEPAEEPEAPVEPTSWIRLGSNPTHITGRRWRAR